jgi:16S rRNA A1518/A1519 N6-dimethyltransferase RsmA/KsgA/DIM1 with predicted DNA glycosylase/AP lyase activity
MRRVLRTITGAAPDAAEHLLRAAGIAPDARPEMLGAGEFARLVEAVASRE